MLESSTFMTNVDERQGVAFVIGKIEQLLEIPKAVANWVCDNLRVRKQQRGFHHGLFVQGCKKRLQ